MKERLKKALDDSLMLLICRSNKSVIRDPKFFPEILKLWCELIAMGLWSNRSLGRRLLDFLPVFIKAGEKEHVVSL